VVLVIVVVLGSAKPHFLPFVFGAGFFGCFLAFFAGHGFASCGTPPLSAELMTGNAAARPRQVTNAASLRVPSFTSKSPPWAVFAFPQMEAAGGAVELRIGGSNYRKAGVSPRLEAPDDVSRVEPESADRRRREARLEALVADRDQETAVPDRKSTRLNSSHNA